MKYFLLILCLISSSLLALDIETYNKLTEEEKNEYQLVSDKFINAVLNSGLQDGYNFKLVYSVQYINRKWCLAKKGSQEPFAGITSSKKAVIEALLTDAVQNYGR